MVALEELEEQLRTELDEPDLAEAATRALVPLDESKARLMLRYQATAENSLYRAYNALVKARKEREAAGEDAEPVAPVVTVADVDEAPPAAAEPLPNKANPADDAPEAPAGPLPNKANSARRGVGRRSRRGRDRGRCEQSQSGRRGRGRLAAEQSEIRRPGPGRPAAERSQARATLDR